MAKKVVSSERAKQFVLPSHFAPLHMKKGTKEATKNEKMDRKVTNFYKKVILIRHKKIEMIYNYIMDEMDGT